MTAFVYCCDFLQVSCFKKLVSMIYKTVASCVYVEILVQAFLQLVTDTYAVFSPTSMAGDDDFRESCS